MCVCVCVFVFVCAFCVCVYCLWVRVAAAWCSSDLNQIRRSLTEREIAQMLVHPHWFKSSTAAIITIITIITITIRIRVKSHSTDRWRDREELVFCSKWTIFLELLLLRLGPLYAQIHNLQFFGDWWQDMSLVVFFGRCWMFAFGYICHQLFNSI